MENERQWAIVDFEGLDVVDERLERVMKARKELNDDAVRALSLSGVSFTIEFKPHKEEPVSGN